MAITTTDPTTGKTLRTFEPHSDAEVERRLARAHEALSRWRATSFEERRKCLLNTARWMEHRIDELAALMTQEMGKPLGAARSEVAKCVSALRYYADNAERFLADEPVHFPDGEAWVRYEPLGVLLAIMPWNFPFWQVVRFAAPALMAGNVGLLKHASNVPQCALALEELFRAGGCPEGVFQTLLLEGGAVERVVADGRVQGVSLTGSDKVGREVGALAGRHLKKVVLELGGSDPFVVMPSADLERAVETAVQARVINNGQSCIAAKRFIVARDVAEEFERRFVERMGKLVVGNPAEPGTEVGPLATAGIRDGLHAQVEASVKAGTRLLLGGKRPQGAGWFYPPTVLADPPRGSPAHDEELFGPVATLFRVADLEEALQRANDTPFGLGASVWTREPEEQARLVAGIHSGMVFVNAMVASDPRLPFGGVKASGHGRELGRHGIYEFVNAKSVRVVE